MSKNFMVLNIATGNEIIINEFRVDEYASWKPKRTPCTENVTQRWVRNYFVRSWGTLEVSTSTFGGCIVTQRAC